MQLLSEDKLVWSPTVANSRMNRKRTSSGINSYEKEFKFKPEVYLESKIKESGQSSWLDLCCGEGNALIQTAHYFYDKGIQENIKLKGIDLLNSFQSIDKKITCIAFEAKSVVDWIPDQKYDLITCSHGIHYLGDKLKVIETAIACLSTTGMFVANLDLSNIIIEGSNSNLLLKNFFKKSQIEYNNRSKIMKRVGSASIKFGFRYIGADDTSGPNYSGQDAVSSYYSNK
jgi:ubiquinone/menaquinone biosynthesis C-methylase UbiE